MKTNILKFLIPILAGSTTSAFAAATSLGNGGSGVLIWFVIGFGVMILLFQAAPAMVMFFSLVKGLFSSSIPEGSLSIQKIKSK